MTAIGVILEENSMSRDYQEEHDKAFDEIYEFLNFANPEVLPKKKNALGLSELVELVLDLTANNMTYTSILQIAYENALPPENFDSFF